MSSTQRLVSPKLPTVLAGHASVDLPGYDLYDYILDVVWVLPAKLNIYKFEKALSSVLQIYPHAAGQLRSSDGRWFIELTNTPVPVDIDYSPGTTSSDALLNGDWVIQDDLSPFTSRKHHSARSANNSDPLLHFKLTFFDDETSIGLTWHHFLGDILVIFRFVHTLSQFYQGLPQVFPSPTFEKYHFPKPSPAVLAEFWPYVPHLHVTRPDSESGETLTELLGVLENTRWRIENRGLAELHSVLSSRAQSGSRLSQQDCLAAYVIAVLNHNISTPVRTVMNLTNFREVRAPFVAKDVAGNLMENIHTTVPADICGIATALRRALVQGKKPDRVHGLMSVASHLILDTMNTGKAFDMFHDDLVVFVNSTTALDGSSIHFGCPDGVRHFTSGMGKLYLRCFKSNPVKRDNGAWHPRQSVDISMGVTKELKPRLLETFGRGIQYVVKNERTRL